MSSTIIKEYLELKSRYSAKYKEVKEKILSGNVDDILKSQKELIALDRKVTALAGTYLSEIYGISRNAR